MGRRAMLLGATGLVGSRCLEHLLEHDAYDHVTCLVRRPSLTTSAKLAERVVDFAALRASDLDPAEDLYCALGTTMKKAGTREAFHHVDVEIPLAVAELAGASGLRRIALVSSVGADARSRIFYLRTKGELEEALAALPLEALHVFRPGALVGARRESRPTEAMSIVLARATQGLLLGGLRKYRPIDADDVGRAMVAAMVGPEPQPARRIYEHDAIAQLARRQ